MSSKVTFWDGKEHIVYVVEIAFYSVLFIASVAALLRRRQLVKGTILCTISALKISGSAVSVHAAIQTVNAINSPDTSKFPSTSLVTVGAILTSLATAPLLVLTRAFCPEDSLHKKLQRFSRILVIVPAILAIVGYNYWADGGSSMDTGIALVKASSILYVALYLLFVASGLKKYLQIRDSATRLEATGIFIVLTAMPFFIVRFVFVIASSFSLTTNMNAHHKFSYFDGDWRISLSMFVVMEFVVEIVYCFGVHLLISREAQQSFASSDEATEKESA
ncbi:LAFA_0F03950g1_1 [Lachancea sp. 'fantastica']|nr:LAFA_0F03950g1_1 [Lachancea sp. 'fantastica']